MKITILLVLILVIEKYALYIYTWSWHSRVPWYYLRRLKGSSGNTSVRPKRASISSPPDKWMAVMYWENLIPHLLHSVHIICIFKSMSPVLIEVASSLRVALSRVAMMGVCGSKQTLCFFPKKYFHRWFIRRPLPMEKQMIIQTQDNIIINGVRSIWVWFHWTLIP